MSLRRAINAKCRDCIYDSKAGGTWLAQVAQCSCAGCPLWPARPAPKDGKFSNPPRRPEQITREWLNAGAGGAVSALALTELRAPATHVAGSVDTGEIHRVMGMQSRHDALSVTTEAQQRAGG